MLRHRGPAARTNFVIPSQPVAGPDAGPHAAGCAATCPTPADPLAADPAGGCPAPAAARELAALQKPSRRSARADAPRSARWAPGAEGGDGGEGEWGAGARRSAPARESGYMGVSWRGPRQRWVAELWDGQAYELLGAWAPLALGGPDDCYSCCSVHHRQTDAGGLCHGVSCPMAAMQHP